MHFSSKYRGSQRRNGGFNSSNRGRKSSSNNIDVSKFINRSVDLIPEPKYRAVNSFSDFNIHPTIKQNIAKKGYLVPTPIQDQSIQAILDGRDLVGIANTGTGKTGAFLIPLVDKVVQDRSQKVLIVVPTRELASQIEQEFKSLSENLQMQSALCIGGVGLGNQILNLRRNPAFVIGTPGRLKDLSLRGYIRFGDYENLVLDEVDRMFDMGFINDIKQILASLPKKRLSLFFSATMSEEIKRLILSYVYQPVYITVKTTQGPQNIDQDVVRVQDQKEKIEVLHNLLIQSEFKKVLIFGKTKWSVRKLSDELESRGFKSDSIHGDKSQNQRLAALNKFRNNNLNILVATDVASRGLDIEGVTHVINYDLPNSYEDYIHRIGRTGRADNKGTALTFVG